MVAAARVVAARPAAEPGKGCLLGWAEMWVLVATGRGAWADLVAAVVEERMVGGESEVAMVVEEEDWWMWGVSAMEDDDVSLIQNSSPIMTSYWDVVGNYLRPMAACQLIGTFRESEALQLGGDIFLNYAFASHRTNA